MSINIKTQNLFKNTPLPLSNTSTDTNMKYANKYVDNGFIPFTLNIQSNNDGKKELIMCQI